MSQTREIDLAKPALLPLSRRVDRRTFLIIHNFRAGRQIRPLLEQVLANLRTAGRDVTIVNTGSHGDGTAAAAEAANSGKFETVVAAGGDGTIHDVAEGSWEARPARHNSSGTGNVYARELGIGFSAEGLRIF
jgi:diacylglycerol kinase (ATP)